MAENALDSFSRLLPLPYRIAILLTLGIWAWGLNLHGLSYFQIDVEGLIGHSKRSASAEQHPHLSVYRLATAITLPLLVSLLFFWSATHGDEISARRWVVLPHLSLVLLPILFVLPFKGLSVTGRYRFLATLARISVGGIAKAQNGRFGDTLLADALTSYGRVLGDLFMLFCTLCSNGTSSSKAPDRNCEISWAPVLITIYPSVIRLRQCLIEYSRVSSSRHLASDSGSPGSGAQHLINALKYSSAFPVILLASLQRTHGPSTNSHFDEVAHRLWLLSAFTNSAFSFYWDISKDWDLTLFSSQRRGHAEHQWGLRRPLVFRSAKLYYLAIISNFFLRFGWLWSLTTHIGPSLHGEVGAFSMIVLELVRRWLWAFFRVEAEWSSVSHMPARRSD